jgi:RNA recognition motif-containing protein
MSPGGLPLTSRYSQVRQGIASNTKGTAFVVYEDVMDAKQACDKLNGYNFQNRYLVGMFFGLPLRLRFND